MGVVRGGGGASSRGQRERRKDAGGRPGGLPTFRSSERIGITTGPGGEELVLAGEVTPPIEIEMGYTPGAIDAKLRGTVKLIWNSPTATSAAALAGIVTVPIVTVTPSNNVVEIKVPAGRRGQPGGVELHRIAGRRAAECGSIRRIAESLPSRKTPAA